MNPCELCDLLARAPRRFDVPHHLRRVGPPRIDENGQKRPSEYQCVVCASVWRWRDDRGWAEPPLGRFPPKRRPAPPPESTTPSGRPWALRYLRHATQRALCLFHRQDRARPRSMAGFRARHFCSTRGWRRTPRRVKFAPRRRS